MKKADVGADEGSAADGGERRPSKSARKREAAGLQDLGVRLAALPEEQLAELAIPDNLHAALLELKRLSSHGAQLRQRQYIGKLMRKIDPEPVLAKLADRKRRHDAEVRRFRQIERWRDRLLAEPQVAVEELLRDHPGADRAVLQDLLDQAARRTAEGPGAGRSRELFAFLRRLFESALVD